MKQIHNQEKEQFQALFLQEHIDRFEDRFRILEGFLSAEGHITVEDLHQLLTRQGHDLDKPFILDTLELMCQFGFARKNRFDNGKLRFEHLHLGQHHDHMVCTKCGAIAEFKDDRLENRQAELASALGFHVLQHRMEIYGICAKCLPAPITELPLASTKPGDRLTITALTGGAGARIRLMSMGLRVGDAIEVISNLNQGQVVVATEARRFVLGKGLAEKIRVRRIPQAGEGRAAAPAATEPPATLGDMREGQRATIVRVGGNGALRRRLLEMGLLKGTEIYVEKYAPLRDPMELIVKGYHVSLRVEEAAQIMVSDVRFQ